MRKIIFFTAAMLCAQLGYTAYAAGNALPLSECEITCSVEDANINSAFDKDSNSRLYGDGGNSSYTLSFAFENEVVIGGIKYTPYTGEEAGCIDEAVVYASNDGESYYKIGDMNIESAKTSTTCDFMNAVKAKYIRITTTKTVGGKLSIAELELLAGTDSGLELEKAQSICADNSYNTLRSNVKVIASSVHSGAPASNMIDTNMSSMWHSKFSPTRDFPPFSIIFDLGEEREICGLTYLPRQDIYENGRFINCDIFVGKTPSEYTKVADTNWESNYLRKYIYYTPVKARYVNVVVNKTLDDYAIAADLCVLQSEQSKLQARKKNYIRYSMQIGSNIVTMQKGSDISEFQLGTAPTVVNGSTMIPIRGLAEAMGYEVSWQGENMTVRLEKAGSKIKMQVDDDRAYMNNIRYNMQEPPIIINGSALIPVRMFASLAGYDVEWIADTQTVHIGNDLELEW